MPVDDGRPPTPAELLSMRDPAWFDPDEQVPGEVDPEERWAYRLANAWGRWREAQAQWAEENGYSPREMYQLTEAAQGPAVDGVPGATR